MNERMIILIALSLLAIVGAGSAGAAVAAVEIRGTVVEADGAGNLGAAGSGVVYLPGYTWNPHNFAAFWYELDDDMYSECLTINTQLDDRTIAEENLTYRTMPRLQNHVYYMDKGPLGTVDGENVTDYYTEGWMAGKYVAISKGGSTSPNADKLARLLVEFESNDCKTLVVGEPWDLGGGFTLNVTKIDLDNDAVTISLVKNSVILNETVIHTSYGGDRRHMYTEELSGVSDVVVFFCYVDEIFMGPETDLVQLKYIYLIDNDIFRISSGKAYGNMEVMTTSTDNIVLKNNGTIDLSRNTCVEVMDGMYFKVADSETVRFYPFIECTVPTPPEISPAADVDGDGVPDVRDADNSTLPGYWTDSDGYGRKWGDMNGDGKITSVDALIILQVAAEKIDIG